MSVAVYGERWRDTCQRRAEQTDELGYAGSLEDGEPTLDGLDARGLQNMEFCPKFFKMPQGRRSPAIVRLAS